MKRPSDSSTSTSKQTRIVYLSPTEHDLKLTIPQSLYSSLCEANGCDILVITSRGCVGFQRKTLGDLEVSLRDGRFALQLAQIRSSQLLRYRFVILELDRNRITTDGRHFTDSSLTPESLRTVAFKLFFNDTLLIESRNLSDTVDLINRSADYVERDGADHLLRPKPSTTAWGTRSNRDWGIHLLQSFPGIGPRTAGVIYDSYGLPLQWTVSEKDLTQLPGVGKVIAKRLIAALQPDVDHA